MSYTRQAILRFSAARLLALAAALATLPWALAQAQTGNIEGTVRDQAGAPIVNAQVFVVHTPLQTQTDPTGYYRIERVPVGVVTIQAGFIGYKSHQVVGINVLPDTTVTIDITLEATPFQVEDLTVTAAGAALVPRNQVTTRHRLHGRFAEALPVGKVKGLEGQRDHEFNTEDYRRIYENRFLGVVQNPLSTFSIDVDAASYSNVRRFIREGRLPPKDAVRIEELVNYFEYAYDDPAGDDPFSISTEVVEAPWASAHRLVMIGIQGERIPVKDLPPSNLVFLLDVSGSMRTPNKLPLVKAAFRLLVNELRSEDRVAIVVYAGAAGLVLPSTPGDQKDRILDAIERLHAGGSTAGGAGIRLAYDIARQNHLSNGNNRVILATDGDFNIGASSDGEMVRLIEERREQGAFLTVLGFGTGNLKDSKMEALADKGNGHFAYVDNILEAKKVFVTELGATLFTIAKDVKIQVEFNPNRVVAYRLIGYENRILAAEDFNDDTKDAGELGAGHSVTALYEIIPVGAESAVILGEVDSLKYQRVAVDSPRSGNGEILTVKLRYKEPKGSTSRLIERALKDRVGEPSENLRFAGAVASFGMLLRDSEYKGTSSYEAVLSLARGAKGDDPHGLRAEFINLVESVRMLGGMAVRTGVSNE